MQKMLFFYSCIYSFLLLSLLLIAYLISHVEIIRVTFSVFFFDPSETSICFILMQKFLKIAIIISIFFLFLSVIFPFYAYQDNYLIVAFFFSFPQQLAIR